MPIETRPLPSRERLLELLEYNPETGKLIWRERASGPETWNAKWAGKLALDAKHSNGYRRGCIDYQYVFAHRVIYKMMTGLEPPQIDHHDGDRANNRWGNLFAATALDNARNAKKRCTNKSGRVGVHMGRSGKWIAQIRRGGRVRHLGSFSSFEAACEARAKAEAEIGFRVRPS